MLNYFWYSIKNCSVLQYKFTVFEWLRKWLVDTNAQSALWPLVTSTATPQPHYSHILTLYVAQKNDDHCHFSANLYHKFYHTNRLSCFSNVGFIIMHLLQWTLCLQTKPQYRVTWICTWLLHVSYKKSFV